jgi:NADPH-dependent 2,4-dienoyl-CoA reductase/sulfur reductase-like enzyme/nitrite reductase/ring-hydroxylating ferredoxin subunit
MADAAEPPQRDLAQGVALAELADGAIVAGRVGEDEVIVLKRGDDVFAIGAHCTHYHGPLAEGLVVGDTVRCPWHHAEFCLRTGEALRAPALDAIACYRVERSGARVAVRGKLDAPQRPSRATGPGTPASIVIVGGGAAGLAAADMLRRQGFAGALTMLSADDSPPVDRPNLSKDFLAGSAPDDWMPLRAPDYYRERGIDLVLDARVAAIDAAQRRVTTEDGRAHGYDALLLATGADPVRLEIPGADPSRLHYLRSFTDSKAIVARTGGATRALVVGASFIGLEVAASLRARGLEVHVVAPEHVPLERVMGDKVGAFVRAVHEANGVAFHLGASLSRMDGDRAILSDGTALRVDFVVLGVGVRPSVALAERAGLAVDRGVVVDARLQTSKAGIFAAGDIARWPDPHTGDRIRVEHWVVAERQGQVAARNMLGERVAFDAVPFFWSQHFDAVIHYVGHAERFDDVAIDGSLDARNATIRFVRAGRTLAVATVGRDFESLRAEAAMEREPAAR